MTDLRQLLHDAAATQKVPMAPVGRIVADGRTRLRRHNIAYVALAAMAVVGLVAAVVPLTFTRGTAPAVEDHRTPRSGPRTLESSLAAWADADTVHYRGAQAKRPEGTLLLTVTGTSAVYVSGGEGGGTVRTLDDDGLVREIGTSDGTGVVTDPTGSWIAWMQKADADGAVELVLHNTQTHETANSTEIAASAGGPAARVVAIDGSQVAYTIGGRLWIWDWVSDDVEPADLSMRDELLDSRRGISVVRRGGRHGDILVFRRQTGEVRPTLALDSAQLSPNGQYAIGYAGVVRPGDGWMVSLISTWDGSEVPLSGLPGEPLVAGWTSGNELVVLSSAARGDNLAVDSPAHVFLCRTDGECHTPPDAPEGTLAETVVPSGSMGPLLLDSVLGATG